MIKYHRVKKLCWKGRRHVRYRELGKTGAMVSALGFGCMRFPMIGEGKDKKVDDEKTGEMLKYAVEHGINYFDSGFGYCRGDGQRAMGKALAPFRDKVYISTKLPMWTFRKQDDFWYYLEESLKRIDTDYIDFYHFHAVNRGFWNMIKRFDLLTLAQRAKEQGMIRHIGFSFHDEVDLLTELVDTGCFENVLCQYNLIDRRNEKAMAYAREKGVGVLIMGPVAGGNIAQGGEEFLKKFVPEGKTPPSGVELAFNFVYGNPAIDCVLSGMENMDMLKQNIELSERFAGNVPKEEWDSMKFDVEEISKLSDLYCPSCEYCLVCPKNIKPLTYFRTYNRWKVWGLEESAKDFYRQLGKTDMAGTNADECLECGLCASKCPQKIDIPNKLKEVNAEFKKLVNG